MDDKQDGISTSLGMGSQISPTEKLKVNPALACRTGQVALGKPLSLLWVKDQEHGQPH